MEQIWYQSYPTGMLKEIAPHTYTSVADILEEAFRKYPDRPAFSNMGTTLTYREIDVASKKFASFLQNNLAMSANDRVALMMPNILQYPIALFGVLRAGMIVVNVNPLYTARELEHQLKDSGAKAIVIFANSAHVLEKVLPQTGVKHVVVTEIGDLLKFPKNLIVNFVIKRIKKMVPHWNITGAISFKEILLSGQLGQFKEVKMAPSNTAFLQYTGGTTGVSKGAELSHGNVIANVMQAKEWIKANLRDGQEIVITPLPLYHIFSLTANCFIFSAIGGLNVLITNPKDIPGFIKELKKWNYTALTGVNTLFNALINNEEFKKLDFSHLRFVIGGGMAVQKTTADKWKEITKVPLLEGYGLSETSPLVTLNLPNSSEFSGNVGLPVPSTIVVMKDDEGKDLPIGEVGEVCVKGPQVMRGYWNRPDETAKVMTADGYFRTGDIGFMDKKGFIKLVDRKKDMILVSGFNVYPNEVEEVLSTHAKVFECAVIGVPDEKSGEKVKAFIVKKDPTLTEEEIIEYCKKNLTGYKIPKLVEFRKDLPKSNVGKILRKDLRQ